MPEGSRYLLTEKFWFGPLISLGGAVGSTPTRRAGDPGSNPGPYVTFSLKLTLLRCRIFFFSNASHVSL